MTKTVKCNFSQLGLNIQGFVWKVKYYVCQHLLLRLRRNKIWTSDISFSIGNTYNHYFIKHWLQWVKANNKHSGSSHITCIWLQEICLLQVLLFKDFFLLLAWLDFTNYKHYRYNIHLHGISKFVEQLKTH